MAIFADLETPKESIPIDLSHSLSIASSSGSSTPPNPPDPQPSMSATKSFEIEPHTIPQHLVLPSGSWVLGNRIGKGGWCYVYEGMLGDLPVAIKVLQEHLRNMPKDIFCREVNQWSQFHHPSIVNL